RSFNFHASPDALKRNLLVFFLRRKEKGEGSLKLSGSLRRGWKGKSLCRCKRQLSFKLLRKVHNNLALPSAKNLLRTSCQVVMNLRVKVRRNQPSSSKIGLKVRRDGPQLS